MRNPPSAVALLRDIVGPAIGSVLRDDEVDSVQLTRQIEGTNVVHELVVVAKGEEFRTVVHDTSVAYPPGGPVEVLREQLVDFVAESRFGWGENRET